MASNSTVTPFAVYCVNPDSFTGDERISIIANNRLRLIDFYKSTVPVDQQLVGASDEFYDFSYNLKCFLKGLVKVIGRGHAQRKCFAGLIDIENLGISAGDFNQIILKDRTSEGTDWKDDYKNLYDMIVEIIRRCELETWPLPNHVSDLFTNLNNPNGLERQILNHWAFYGANEVRHFLSSLRDKNQPHSPTFQSIFDQSFAALFYDHISVEWYIPKTGVLRDVKDTEDDYWNGYKDIPRFLRNVFEHPGNSHNFSAYKHIYSSFPFALSYICRALERGGLFHQFYKDSFFP